MPFVLTRPSSWRLSLLVLMGCLLVTGQTEAVPKKKPPASPAVTARVTAPPAETRRSHLPVLTVTSIGPGQAGYVHYFLLTHPDGSLEYHVGIELGDQRIAWSFPGLGVSVSPFIESGSVNANGTEFGVTHLYGIRPFPDDARMNVLRGEITARVALWIDDETPYCAYRTRGGPFCVSCGDFAVRVLFPGRTNLTAALPGDFFRAPSGAGFAPSTDDLLFYLVGLNEMTSKEAQLKRVAELTLPQALREDLARLLSAEPDAAPAAEAAQLPRARTLNYRATSRPSDKVVPPRQSRKGL